MVNLIKVGGGAMIGVGLPLVSEYALKGGRAFGDAAVAGSGYKYSGLIGVGGGVIGIAVAADKMPGIKVSGEDDKQMAAAYGGASLATGAGILILDELRKKAAWTWKQQAGNRLRKTGGRIPLRRSGLEEQLERIIEPVTPLVEEI